MEQIPENNSEIPKPKHFQSKTLRLAIVVLAELILLIGAFDLGMNVASHKARFTESWVKNYPRNFGRPMMMQNAMIFNAHGLEGTILSLEKNVITLKDEDSNEKTVILIPTTTIRRNNSNLNASDLKPSNEIVVIGSPNADGQIEAKLIRVLNPGQ